MSLIDHIEFAVRDTEVSRLFYERALAPLGFELIITVGPEGTRTGGNRHGLGTNGYPCLWLHEGEPHGKGTHIAFAAEARSLVDAFYEAALAAGGRDNGPPGIRQHYHANYYAAYVLDPDGVNVEVACQQRS
ncbi:VOC family protein [Massilia sp. HP4]|uniref:VOC family protein n=1 Tax=Massilia sp. HP4 TaxID=2562316 RepID=UPI0010C0C0F3|nr:VOC family protein [Massilia sp. HP4]